MKILYFNFYYIDMVFFGDDLNKKNVIVFVFVFFFVVGFNERKSSN